MIRQLQRKFIVIAMISLVTVMIVVLGGVNLTNLSHMNERADGLISLLAENGGKFPEDKMKRTDMPKPDPQWQGEKPPEELRRGRGFQPSAETPFETRYFTVAVDEAGTITAVDMGHIAALSDAEARQYAKDILKSGRHRGYTDTYRYAAVEQSGGSLLTFVDCRNQMDTVSSFFWNCCAIAAASLLIVLLLLTVLSRRAIRPVIESIEKQKQFITDAGHEIKTPLAIISANNDVIEMTAGQSEWTVSTHNQVSRLNGLVKNLLTLAKMEEGQVALVFSSLELSRVVEETAWSFASLAEKRGIDLQVAVQPDISMKGDEASLSHLTAILVDNAVKYADEGGTIQVELTRRGKLCCLEVRNTCGDLPGGDLARLFDRFYRADGSRSRESGGYGIGLSVAQAIVEAHGGRISACRSGDDTICFVAEMS